MFTLYYLFSLILSCSCCPCMWSCYIFRHVIKLKYQEVWYGACLGRLSIVNFFWKKFNVRICRPVNICMFWIRKIKYKYKIHQLKHTLNIRYWLLKSLKNIQKKWDKFVLKTRQRVSYLGLFKQSYTLRVWMLELYKNNKRYHHRV